MRLILHILVLSSGENVIFRLIPESCSCSEFEIIRANFCVFLVIRPVSSSISVCQRLHWGFALLKFLLEILNLIHFYRIHPLLKCLHSFLLTPCYFCRIFQLLDFLFGFFRLYWVLDECWSVIRFSVLNLVACFWVQSWQLFVYFLHFIIYLFYIFHMWEFLKLHLYHMLMTMFRSMRMFWSFIS